MGCAGGIDVTTTLALSREAVPAGYSTFTLTLKGLKGGHSGGDIHLGLGNANKLLARFLAGHATELGARLVDFQGGTLRNAIPREGHITLAVPEDKAAQLKSLAQTLKRCSEKSSRRKRKTGCHPGSCNRCSGRSDR